MRATSNATGARVGVLPWRVSRALQIGAAIVCARHALHAHRLSIRLIQRVDEPRTLNEQYRNNEFVGVCDFGKDRAARRKPATAIASMETTPFGGKNE